jgi:predicted nucleotidyltransferase
MDSLTALAAELSVPERTLRRAAASGLIRGRRISPRRFHTPLREEMYLRSNWQMLSDLRSALRTEPRVRLAVLHGSTATDIDRESSDLDIVALLQENNVGQVAELSDRLTQKLGRDTRIIRLSDAEQAPMLMASILEQGRALVDREQLWPELQAAERKWQRKARKYMRALPEAPATLEIDTGT